MRPYPKTPVLGRAPEHDGTGRLLADHPDPVGAVVVHEKVDGSQLSWWLDGGDLVVQSRTRLVPDDDKEFGAARQHLRSVAAHLLPHVTYRGEYLRGPRHNVISYARAPKGGIVLWAIEVAAFVTASADALTAVAAKLEVDPATVLYEGPPLTMEAYQALVRADSQTLGGPCEGIVIKDASGLVAKIVRAEYAETKSTPKASRPAAATAVAEIITQHATSMRYAKAAQRLRDDGRLTGTRSDIGPLMAEVQRDVEEECAAQIKEQLWAAYRKDILRGVAAGVREYVDGGVQ